MINENDKIFEELKNMPTPEIPDYDVIYFVEWIKEKLLEKENDKAGNTKIF